MESIHGLVELFTKVILKTDLELVKVSWYMPLVINMMGNGTMESKQNKII